MTEEEKKSWWKSFAYSGIGFLVMLIVLWILPEPSSAKQENQIECHYWMYDYVYRGRANYDVLCNNQLRLNENGDLVPLPDHLEKLKPDINKQWNILKERITLNDSLNP